MTRIEAITKIEAALDRLTDERLAVLGDLVDALMRNVPEEEDTTSAAIAEGVAQADRGEFATDEQVKAAFARFAP